jgi:hypothetical protein
MLEPALARRHRHAEVALDLRDGRGPAKIAAEVEIAPRGFEESAQRLGKIEPRAVRVEALREAPR